MTPNNDVGSQSGGEHCGFAQYLTMSDTMRAYIDSLPQKLSLKEEITSYQFWKSLRTEFLASFLFVVFGCGSIVAVHSSTKWMSTNSTTMGQVSLGSTPLDTTYQLQIALALGLTVATLIQCTGHVSGCHLSIAITVGFFVSGRITPVRLTAYLFVQCLAMCLGALVVHALFNTISPITPSSHLTPSQVFGFEFLSTLLVVLTYLANCDVHRIDLGFKALSIGFAYTVGHLFAYSSTGASMSPARALSVSLITGQWCLHWIYWISPFVAGLFGGLAYEYIGSIKPPVMTNNCNCECNQMTRSATAEIKRQFTEKTPNSNSANEQAITAMHLSPETFSINETEFSIATDVDAGEQRIRY